MKRIICIFLLILISINLFSCRNKGIEDNETEYNEYDKNIQGYIDEIYAVDENSSATAEERKKKNLIDVKTVSSKDSNAPLVLKKEILGTEYDLTYVETLTYPLNGEVVDKYVADIFGENGSVLINKDGSVSSLLFDFASIDITGNESPQSIKTLIEAVICEIVDISNYDYCDIPEYFPEKESFGSYNFLYYNMENGYMTDFMKVIVKDDGRIRSLSINNLEFECDLSNVIIDKDLEDKLLNAKTEQIFGNKNGSYITYEKVENIKPNMYMYGDELVIMYYVTAVYEDLYGQQQSSGYIQRILIPLRLLNSTSSAE